MCFPNCPKYLLVILNIAIFVSGAAITVAGLLLFLETGLFDNDVISLLDEIKYGSVKVGLLLQCVCFMMIACGGIIMIIAVVGIVGAWKKIKCCLLVFVFFVVLIILVQGALIGLWISLHGRSDEWLEGELKLLLDDYQGPDQTDDISCGFNKMFRKVRCCGVTTYEDMEQLPTPWFTNTGSGNSEKIPATCCQGVETDEEIANFASSTCTQTPQDYYSSGCYDVIRDKVRDYLLIMSITCSIGFVIEIAVIVLTCMVLDQAKNRIRSATGGSSQNKPPPYVGIDPILKNQRTLQRHY